MTVHFGQTLEKNVGTSEISHEDEPSMVEPAISNDRKIIDQIVDSKQVEFLLTQELNQMSLKERELMYEEIHSVDKMIDEPTEFVTERLEALERELRMISIKPAYDQAEQISKLYVTDQKLRLQFLRAEYFDARKAAHRLVSFMEGKLHFFGPDVLARSVYLSDLDDDDFEFLKSGVDQLLPSRDRAGRAIFFQFVSPRIYYKRPDNMFKAFIYLVLAACEDDETQRCGIVSVCSGMGPIADKLDHAISSRLPRMMDWLPIKVTAIHMLVDDPIVRSLSPLIRLGMGRERRLRFRMHYGTQTENIYMLLTFGIPVDVLPVAYDGGLKVSNHLEWVSRRQTKDSDLFLKGFFHGIDLPRRHDLLLGRGKTIQEHPGNLHMRSLVDSHFDRSKKASTGEKNILAGQIVAIMKRCRCRFLKKKKDGWWVEVPDNEAIVRVLRTFKTAQTAISKPISKSRFHEFENRKRAKLAERQNDDGCNSLFCGQRV